MTDREMLELAAKAGKYDRALSMPYYDDCGLGGWNPLKDNSAAFELAAKLKFTVYFFNDGAQVLLPGLEMRKIIEKNKDNLVAARRAIVLAASEIAKVQLNKEA